MIKYKIALVNVFWSENDTNTRYFINQNEQNIYFDNLASGKTSPLVNYNMGNNIETTIVYKDTTNRRVDEIVKSNYAIVYTINVENEVEQIVNRRYFFAYPRQDSGRQMIVDLVLDDVQTNFLSRQGLFDQQVMIKRAHLNRFSLTTTNNYFEFAIGSPNSPFYQIEDFPECPKRLTKRTSLNLQIDKLSDFSDFNVYCNSNIIGWEYVYLAPKGASVPNYNALLLRSNDYDATWLVESKPVKSFFYDSANNFYGEHTTDGNKCNGSLICLCAPIYRLNSDGYNNSIMFSADGYNVALSTFGIQKFLELNGNYSYVYARKFSIRPPFKCASISSSNYSVNTQDNNLIINGYGHTWQSSDPSRGYNYIEALNYTTRAIYTGYTTNASDTEKYRQGCILVDIDYDGTDPYETQEYLVDKPLLFTASVIVESSKDNLYLNPKLLSNQFFEVNITNFSQNYTYDFQKINKQSFKILYNEALTPDITKGYARLKGSNGLYIEDCERNLTGLVISNDYSLMVANDKLSEMLANNKNFYLQQALNIGQKTIFGGLGGAMSGGLVGASAGIVSGLSNIPNVAMQLDNMRNAPAQVRNANGNVYFASDIQPFKLAIEEYEALDFDKKAFNDYCYMFGYKYNRMGLLSDFVNIRAQFNYIEADLINVSVPIQNEEKRRLKERFNNGIRFWNTDLPDFSRQNYENAVYEVYQREVNNE